MNCRGLVNRDKHQWSANRDQCEVCGVLGVQLPNIIVQLGSTLPKRTGFDPKNLIKAASALGLLTKTQCEALMKFDPNDALVASGCCGSPVAVYRDGIWSCETCGVINKERSNITEAVRKDSFQPYGYPTYKPKCECGAEKTPNSNCHAFWCPRYGK